MNEDEIHSSKIRTSEYETYEEIDTVIRIITFISILIIIIVLATVIVCGTVHSAIYCNSKYPYSGIIVVIVVLLIAARLTNKVIENG